MERDVIRKNLVNHKLGCDWPNSTQQNLQHHLQTYTMLKIRTIGLSVAQTDYINLFWRDKSNSLYVLLDS